MNPEIEPYVDRSREVPKINIEYREGDILERYELGDEISNSENGGQGAVFKATRKSDGKPVIVKSYSTGSSGTWEEIFNEEKRAGREIGIIRRANLDGIQGFADMIEYGTTGSHIKHPVAVFEPIPGRTLDDELMDVSVGGFSLEKFGKTMSGLYIPIHYAHTSGTEPVIHRDLNTGNIMINGHPIILDWAGAGTPSTGRTLLRTQIFTPYFGAPELLENPEEGFDERADVYGLGKVAQAILLRKVFKESGGEPTKEDFDRLNIPRNIYRVLGKATERQPELRYRTAKEFQDNLQDALGYSLLPEIKPEQEPTNSALARIAAHMGIDSDEGEKSGLPELCDDWIVETIEEMEAGKWGPGKPMIFRMGEAQVDLSTGRTPYQSLKDLWDGPGTYEQKRDLTRATTQYFAKYNIVIKETFDGKRTLESIAMEKRPTIDGFRDTHYSSAGEFHLEALMKYKRNRAQLLELVGMNEKDFEHDNIGSLLGGVMGLGIYGLPSIFFNVPVELALGGLAFGTIVGPRIYIHKNVKKLHSKLKEFDGWIREARQVEKGQNQGGDLERRVAEAEKSIGRDLLNIDKRASKISKRTHEVATVASTGLIGFLGYLSGGTVDESIKGMVMGGLVGTVLGVYCGTMPAAIASEVYTTIATRRAKKKRRKDAGLPADGLAYEVPLRLRDQEDGGFKKILKDIGLKEKKFRNKFVGDDVEVKYKPYYEQEASLPNSLKTELYYYLYTDVTVRARTPERRDEIERILQPEKPSLQEPRKNEMLEENIRLGEEIFTLENRIRELNGLSQRAASLQESRENEIIEEHRRLEEEIKTRKQRILELNRRDGGLRPGGFLDPDSEQSFKSAQADKDLEAMRNRRRAANEVIDRIR